MNRIKALNITLFVLIFLAAALIASDLASHRLTRLFPATTNDSKPAVRQPSRDDFAGLAPIVEKGLFGKHTQGKLVATARQTQVTATAAPAASAADLMLLGTAIGSFRETFALIQRQGTREERVFRLGEKVFDAGRLLAVKKDSAVLLVNGKRVTLATPAAPGSAASPQSQPQSIPQSSAGSLATQVGSGSYVVDQRALNAALDNVGQTMTDARLVPSMKDGRVEGFRLSEVKPAGVFGMLGMRNGDVLLSLNDFPVDSPDKALQSFVSLKGQSRLKVDIIRDSHPVTLNYDVR